MTLHRARFAVSPRANAAAVAAVHALAYLDVWRSLRAEGKEPAEVADKLTLARERFKAALDDVDRLIAEGRPS